MSNHLAIYPGSFDPITNGHVDLIHRGLALFDDRLIVAVAKNPRKAALFNADERVELIKGAVGDPRVKVTSFSGLLIDHAHELGAKTLLRGMRALADFEYEFQFAHMNRRLAPDIDTVFMITSAENFYVSSSLAKEVAMFGGDVSGLVPPNVESALKEKLAGQASEE